VPNLNLLQQIRKYYPDAPRAHTVSPFELIPLTIVTMIISYLDHKGLSRIAAVPSTRPTACLDRVRVLTRRLSVSGEQRVQ
jgi:hypothetical protein